VHTSAILVRGSAHALLVANDMQTAMVAAEARRTASLVTAP